MNNGSTGAMLAGALLLLSGAAMAAEPSASAAKSSTRSDTVITANLSTSASLDNKLRLVKQLLTQAPAAQRIAKSNNVLAKKKLADAQVLHGRAQAEHSAGRAGMANQLLDEALRQISSASSLVPDIAQQEVQERNQNTQLREAIVTFQALQSSLSRRQAPAQAPAVTADVGRIDGLLQHADDLMASGNQHAANGVLNSAYKVVVSTLSKMLAAETIVYGLKFDSPADEFRHELARNRGYEELIPIALAQLNTARETAVLAESYVKQSRDLRDAANKRASSGDYPAAVKTLQDATEHLQRSLRVAGVVVPQSTERTP